MSWREILFRVLSVFFLIAINAFFVITEFSIVSLRKSRINQLVLAGDVQAKTVQSIHHSLDRLLSTTQLGITLSSLALGWIGEGTMAILIKYLINHFPFPLYIKEAISHSLAIPVAFVLIVYLQIVLGELCPKSIALMYAEQLARFLAPASIVIGRVFNPFIWILNQSTRFLLKLIGIQYTGQGYSKQVTLEEVQSIINTEKELSGLEKEGRILLNNVFEFGDVEAQEVMTPHINIQALTCKTTCQELLKKVAETEFSRYPVFGESLDDIKGMIDVKDIICALAEQKMNLDTPILDLMKPMRFFAESMLLSELLPLMQRYRLKMVIMVDEYGSTSGLITRQNLINEIIGEEMEIKAKKASLIKKINNHTFLISTQINVEELNELINLNLPLIDEYQTLGGFLCYQWQKIPHQGETFTFDNLELTVTKAQNNRLQEVKITRLS